MAIVQWSGLQLWHNVVKRSIFIKFFYLIYIMVMAKWLALLLFIYVDHLMRDRSQCCLCYFTLITGCGIGKPLFIFLSHWLWHCGHLCCYSSTFFKKTGQSRPLFCLFLFFSSYNFNNTNWKKHWWCAWDSNPGPQDSRRRQNHGDMFVNLCYWF